MASSTAPQSVKGQLQAQVQPYASASGTNSTASHNPSFSSAAGRQQRGAPNGAANRTSRPQSDLKSAASMKETNTPEKHANDRLVFLLAHFVGNLAHITVKNGDQFTGIFSSTSLPRESGTSPQYVLKMTKRQLRQTSQTNGHTREHEEYVGSGNEHTMVFDAKDVLHINVPNVSTDKAQAKLTNGVANNFRTDTDISGGNHGSRERELQRWEPSGNTANDLTFSDTGRVGWDQFEANERLYGLTTDYDETYYTTAIDRTSANYKQRAADAERIAREIEGSTATNVHVAEERNQIPAATDGPDEEDRFSGVKRETPTATSTQSNKYTPPARRAPTAQSTVLGAPIDPAIISSQLARPELATRPSKTQSPPIPALPAQAAVTKKENIEPATKESTLPVEDTNQVKQAVPAAMKDVDDEPTASPIPNKTTVIPNTPTRSTAAPITALPNTTANVERDVLNEFRNFALREKLTVAERQRMTAKKEREVKLNDLKKFASNFKLKSAVPPDMLGILAKDKQKQLEIVEKSQRQLNEQETAKVVAAAKAEQKSVPQTPDMNVDLSQTPGSAQLEKQNGKTIRPTQQIQTTFNVRGDRTSQPLAGPILSPKTAGQATLGQRLLQQQPQMRDRAIQSISGPSTGGNYGQQKSGMSNNGLTASARLNVQATEFKPNPTAVSFSPAGERNSGVLSPPRTRNQPPPRILNRTSFFSGARPDPSNKKSIKDAFNPIAKMKKEVESQGRTKDFVTNGGIPQAYRTPPTWDTLDEYKDKSYVDMFEKPAIPAQSISPANVSLPHQHQLPLHLQGPHPVQQPNHLSHFQGFPQQMHGRNADHRFDEQRMQFPASQSSQFPSPRMPQVMLPFNNQMMGQIQPQFGQPIGPFPYVANAQQMNQLRQFPQFIAPNMATPVVLQPGVPLMGVPIHPHTPMFSPAQTHVLPAHMMNQHGSTGPSGFSSPRGGHLMMHQGSQQGHVPPGQVYMTPGQHPGQLYPSTHQLQGGPHMRGGIPMTHQSSFGGGSHMPQHFPGQQRQYSQMGNNYGVQSHQMDHGMSQQHHPPAAPMNASGDREDSK